MELIKFVSEITCEDGVILKVVSESEATTFFNIINDNQDYFSEFEFIAPDFKSIDEVRDTISALTSFCNNRNGVSYGLWRSGNLLGLFTINKVDWGEKLAEVGFWLTGNAAGNGVASNVLKHFVDHCFSQLKLAELRAFTAVSNVKTQRLLEKVGFLQENLIKSNIQVRGEDIDEYMYKINNKVISH